MKGFSTSPAQRLMGRRTHTLLPTAEKLLRPNIDMTTTASNLTARKRLQCKYYNRDIKNLAPFIIGGVIRMKPPGEQKWSFGHCTRPLGRQSQRSRGRWTALLQKPPSAAVYPGATSWNFMDSLILRQATDSSGGHDRCGGRNTRSLEMRESLQGCIQIILLFCYC